jgi:dihydrofolate reductase
MTEIRLFIATTLDGFIAREDGSLDWLDEVGSKEHTDAGYTDFIENIDSVVLGRKTYEEILSFGIDWPYKDHKTIIITSDKTYKTKTVNTSVLNKINKDAINKIKSDSSKNIWIVGGGQLISEFINNDAIDEITTTIIPIILGKGIKLFPNSPKETKLKLINAQSFDSGMVNLTYRLEGVPTVPRGTVDKK